jgi:hypothetical protein
MHSDLMWQSVAQRGHDFRRTAELERRARTVDAYHPPPAARLTLRVDRVWDSVRLHELAKLAGRPLPNDSFVVGEIDGRIVAALPLSGGRALADPDAATVQLIPLLELRASQIRRVAMSKGRSRLRLRRT